MDLKFRENILHSLNSGLEDIFNHYNTRIDTLENKVTTTQKSLDTLQDKYDKLEKNYTELKDDFDAYKKVSLVKNLNDQLFDKNNEISILNKKIIGLENKCQTVTENIQKNNNISSFKNEEKSKNKNETENKNEIEKENETDTEEIEVSFIEKTIRGKNCYITEDEDREIYEKLDNGDVGELIGKYNENNRPVLFKNNKNK